MTPGTENDSRISNIYVDTQNLGDGSFQEKIEIIKGALDRWPSHLPRVTSIHAYIDSSEEDLWRNAFRNLTSSFPSLEISLRPIQRYNYSPNPGTNAADIALVLDALSDLLSPMPIDFAAIISNDSGFVSLYFKLHRLVSERKLRPVAQVDGIPFLLFTHDSSGLSSRIRENLGENVIHITANASTSESESRRLQALATLPSDNQTVPIPSPTLQSARRSLSERYSNEQLAGAIANGFGRNRWEMGHNTYTFNHTAVFGVIRGRWPDSQEAIQGLQDDFSRWFYEEVWPVMEQYGAAISSKPRPEPRSYSYNLEWEIREKLRALNPES